MHREFLPDDAGMIFLFEEEIAGGFWMKNTLIPLSIAFVAGNGEIVRILDMEPCEADPCEIYDPGVTYSSALEVNQGVRELGCRGGRPAHAVAVTTASTSISRSPRGIEQRRHDHRRFAGRTSENDSPCALAKPSKASASVR